MAIQLGYDEAGSGPMLLLVHGFPMDRRLWQHQLTGLADVRRVLAVDLRGRGKSADPAGPYTIDDLADDLAATLDALNVRTVDLGALSMGGYVALSFLARHRARVRSLILMDTKAVADTEPAKLARVATAQTVVEHGTAALYAALAPKLLAPAHLASVGPALAAMMRDLPAATAARDSLAMRDRPDRSAELGQVTVPALVIHGARDELMPWQDAERMAQALPDGSFHRIETAGHLPPLECPEQTNAAIRAFLARTGTHSDDRLG